MLKTVLDVPHTGEQDEYESSRENGYSVETKSYRHTDTGDYPETRGSRHAMERIVAEDDEPGAQESDTSDDGGRGAQGIKIQDTDVRQTNQVCRYDEKAGAERYDAERAHTCRLLRDSSPFRTYHGPQEHRENKFPEDYNGRIKKLFDR